MSQEDYFDRVYEKTYRPLLRYAIVHLSDPTDAEDALQNVYIDFYNRIERYGHLDILAPKAFLLKMLRREIIKHYAEREKERAYLVEDTEAETLADGVSFEDLALDRVMANRVLDAAKRLPQETYRVFVLYYGFEMSVSDIADELSLSREAVKSRLFRARNSLRAMLSGAAPVSKRRANHE